MQSNHISGSGFHVGLCLPETLVRSPGNHNSILFEFHQCSKCGLWHTLGLWGCHIFIQVEVVVFFLQTGIESWGRQERSVTTKTEELIAYLFFVQPLKAFQKAELTYICCIILLAESNSFCLWQGWGCLSHGRCNTPETRCSTPDRAFHWDFWYLQMSRRICPPVLLHTVEHASWYLHLVDSGEAKPSEELLLGYYKCCTYRVQTLLVWWVKIITGHVLVS